MDSLTALVKQAARGSSAAMEEFVGLSYNDVRRLCASLVDDGTADDLAQETFLRVVHQLSRFRGEASARTWILSIAHHVCMDELRGRTRVRRRDGQRQPGDPGDVGEPDQSETVCVSDLISTLDTDRREAFVLTQVFGLSYAEVATMVGCATGTVASRVSRARSDLILKVGRSEGAHRDRA